MFALLALVTNNKYWVLHSWMIRLILRLRGVRVAPGFHCQGVPRLQIRGRADNIVIEENVRFLGDVDLRNRENGRLVFCRDVVVEGDCRFVAARDGELRIGSGSIVTKGALLNGGADLIIGEQCIIGPRCSINANEHVFQRDTPVREAGFIHEPVSIEDDCWIAANVVINKGVTLGRGSVIGAGAVVTRSTEPYSVNVGAPAKKIGERS
ncbi:MAG: acyltransferase [Desulfovibrionaceae bacterium]